MGLADIRYRDFAASAESANLRIRSIIARHFRMPTIVNRRAIFKIKYRNETKLIGSDRKVRDAN